MMAVENSVPQQKTHKHQESNVKETIESILVAFILAFVFRAFVVEAFVIPTGSMGPTLMGAHRRVTCDDCGYSFQVNYSSTNRQGDDTDIPSSVVVQPGETVICPNCGYRQPLGKAGSEPIYFGDRILVLKYRYVFQDPQRWDVIVFKSPFEKTRDPDDPKYPDAYIKRLIGKPGESVMILDGDIYIGAPGMKPTDFRIQRKPRYAQEALWRDVYDNDYLPHGLSRGPTTPEWRDPWEVQSGSGWQGPSGTNNPSRRFQFDNPQGSSIIVYNSTANHPSVDSLTDWLAYDQLDPFSGGTSTSYVSDLKLSCVYRRKTGQGPLRLQLTKHQDCFTAEFLPGKVVLHRDHVAGTDPLQLGEPVWTTPLEAAVPALSSVDSPVEIEFSNVDYRVSIRINGKDVLNTTDQQYYPNVDALLQTALDSPHRRGKADSDKPIVRIIGQTQAFSLDHLRLARDVYYLNSGGNRYTPEGTPAGGKPYWGSPENIQNLGPDEYFAMGDNSLVSLDARFWGAPVNLPHEGGYYVDAGKVPGRFLLGKAFFVYWPAGYRPPSLSFGIEPDFGDMRFIH
jgi:signal peptidase I